MNFHVTMHPLGGGGLAQSVIDKMAEPQEKEVA